MDRMSTKGQMIDQIDLSAVPHSGFDRSNHNYGSGRLGTIMPARLDEVYPGDRIKGQPEGVINFEPLAAPLMGSMVYKTESFFVPYIQLWRHAYKFFTGKDGFNEDMPSISPYDIWDWYNTNIHSNIWSMIGSGSTADQTLYGFLYMMYTYMNDEGVTFSYISGSTFKETLKVYFLNPCYNTLYAFYKDHKMVDLVLPVYERVKRFCNSDLVNTIDSVVNTNSVDDLGAEGHQTIIGYWRDFATELGNTLLDFFNYFHGVSSLCDYIGWPIPSIGLVTDADSSYGFTNIFQETVYSVIVLSDVIELKAELDSRFSQIPLNFMPFRAYYLIWYWNYRDQLLETGILDPTEDDFLGSEVSDMQILYCTLMRQRCWFKDTFTTALTNTGDGNLLVPVNSGDDNFVYYYYDNEGTLINTTDYKSALDAGANICRVQVANYTHYDIPMNYLIGAMHGTDRFDTDQMDYLSLDMFDRVRRLRSFVQKKLILGYEVDDVIYSSFLVKMSNVRMHIPELLGRGRDAVQITTVVNNTTTNNQIAGDKTATAWAHGKQSEMNYFSEEWGLFFTFQTVLPIQSYAGGMLRLYLKKNVFDFMWPEFATMGMDAVYNCELAAPGRLTDADALTVFGYQGRYYDLKSRLDEEHGRLLTDLNYLTFSREWDSNNPPKLNYMFVHCWPRTDGFVIDDPLVDLFRYDCYNAHAWERRLPVPSEIIGR